MRGKVSTYTFTLKHEAYYYRPHTLENYVKKWRIEDPTFGKASTALISATHDAQENNLPSTLSDSEQNTHLTVSDSALTGMDHSHIPDLKPPLPTHSSQLSDLPSTGVNNDGNQHKPYFLTSLDYFSIPASASDLSMDQNMMDQSNYTSDTSNFMMPQSSISEVMMHNANLDELIHLQMMQNPHDVCSSLVQTPDNAWGFTSHDIFGNALPLSNNLLPDVNEFEEVQNFAHVNDWTNTMPAVTTAYYNMLPTHELHDVDRNDLPQRLVGHNSLGLSQGNQTLPVARQCRELLRTRSYGAIAKEARLRRRIVQLHYELAQMRMVSEARIIAATRDSNMKDAKITELEKRLHMMEVSPSWQSPSCLPFGPMGDVIHQDEMMDQLLHQRVNDQILLEAREQKKKALAQRAASEISYSGTEETISPHRRKFSSKAIVSLRIVPTNSDKPILRYPPRQIPIDVFQHSVGQELTSEGRSRSSSELTVASSVRRLMRKVSDGILKKSHKDDVLPPPVPELSSPVRRQLSEVHNDIRKRLTTDSGYASMSSPRSSFLNECYHDEEV